jgi:asparagine synthase (glutamine-hydrolysing)
MKTTVAVLDKKGDNAASAVVTALRSLQSRSTDGFCMATPGTAGMAEELERLQNSAVDSRVAMGCVYSRILPEDKPQLAKMEDAALAFEGRLYSPISRTSELQTIVRKLQKEGEKALQKLLADTEGDFSLVVAEKERISAGRDPIGVQPLYYGENADIAALGSNRRVLWKLGIIEPRSFPPGHVARVDRDGFKFTPVKTLVYSKPKRVTMQKAAETLQRLLERSVRMRVRGVREVAVAFSGGLDSSVVAFLAKKCRVNVHLMHVSLRNQPETEDAKRAAEELRLPIAVHLFSDEEVAKVAASVVGLIEEPDPVKAAIGIPFYWTAKKTAEAGFKVLLAGQGADELFGGYQRYVNEYLSHGKEKVRRTMFADVARLHDSNIERDRKIGGFHGVELRLPFASYEIAEFAVDLPVEVKIERKANALRKLVLRKVAENAGLPARIVEKPKKAMQYATGVNDALKKLARKHNATVNEYVNNLFLSQMKEN